MIENYLSSMRNAIKEIGFYGKGNTYSVQHGRFFLSIELQGSRVTKGYFVNVGILDTNHGAVTALPVKYEYCHLTGTMDEISGLNSEYTINADNYVDEEFRRHLREAVEFMKQTCMSGIL